MSDRKSASPMRLRNRLIAGPAALGIVLPGAACSAPAETAAPTTTSAPTATSTTTTEPAPPSLIPLPNPEEDAGCVPPVPMTEAWGGMNYADWDFGTSTISSLRFSVHIDNDPGQNSDLYLQLYESDIDNTHQYFGLQTTNGRIIFSQFGSRDQSRVRLGPNSFGRDASDEGDYVSLRYDNGVLPVGDYTVDLSRGAAEGGGDWFNYSVTFPGESTPTDIGGLWFPRSNPSIPATFANNGGTWTEFWRNNGGQIFPVPVWAVEVSVEGDGKGPVGVNVHYESPTNSDTSINSDGTAVMTLGGDTPRCTQPVYVGLTPGQDLLGD